MLIPEVVDWELLVVDNNSTDDTSQVVERYAALLPVRLVFEPKQGLSIARNRAIDEAAGDLILWTDDDVLVDPSWLSAYAEAATRWPDAAYFGGMVTPWYEVEPPPWIRDNVDLLQGMLVIRTLGGQERPFSMCQADFDTPYGANMAFRREILSRYRFNPEIGYVGDRKMFGDETWLVALLQSRDVPGVWVPSAKVRHYIPRDRTTVRFLKEYFYWYGRTLALEETCPDVPLLWDAPRFLYRRYWDMMRRAVVARLLGRPEWVAILIEASTERGRIHEFRERNLAARRPACALECS